MPRQVSVVDNSEDSLSTYVTHSGGSSVHRADKTPSYIRFFFVTYYKFESKWFWPCIWPSSKHLSE